MPTHSHAPRFPRPETLAAFFRMDRQSRVRVSRLARLLDAPAREVRHILRSEGVELRGDSVEWGEAAACLFDAWPRARIIQALGPDRAHLVPPAFHPVRVRWAIPLFIIRAIEHQAALLRAADPREHPGAPDPRFASPSVDDYVADILFNEIQPSTVATLARDDETFLEAYRYPLRD
jgi:hypothetical protein